MIFWRLEIISFLWYKSKFRHLAKSDTVVAMDKPGREPDVEVWVFPGLIGYRTKMFMKAVG